MEEEDDKNPMIGFEATQKKEEVIMGGQGKKGRKRKGNQGRQIEAIVPVKGGFF